jgi:hypothetical protein
MSDIVDTTFFWTGDLVFNRKTANHEHFRSIFLEATKSYNSLNASVNKSLFSELTNMILPFLANKVTNYVELFFSWILVLVS